MSISEIILIIFVALLVIKPERLPEIAQRLGHWIHWSRRTVAKLINHE